jgi:sec-independent protein translocase protein TatA
MPIGFHWYELIPLVLIALLIFGPKKLPELGSSIGKTIKEFQKSMHAVTEPETPPTPTLTPPADSSPAAMVRPQDAAVANSSDAEVRQG